MKILTLKFINICLLSTSHASSPLRDGRVGGGTFYEFNELPESSKETFCLSKRLK